MPRTRVMIAVTVVVRRRRVGVASLVRSSVIVVASLGGSVVAVASLVMGSGRIVVRDALVNFGGSGGLSCVRISGDSGDSGCGDDLVRLWVKMTFRFDSFLCRCLFTWL